MPTANNSAAPSAAANKQLILDYFDTVCGKRNDRPIDDFFTSDVVWQVPQSNPMIVPNPRRGHAAVMDLLMSGVGVYKPGSLQIDLQRVIADDEQAAAQFTLSAQLANGNDYVNHYCFLFSISAGKIDHLWEYLDTLYQSHQGAFAAVD
jgi:ketosteroid isomerase-like protein